MEDKYIGEVFGCYKIIGKLDKKYSDCHTQYIGECVYCGYKQFDKIGDFKEHVKKYCRHNKYIRCRIKKNLFYSDILCSIFRQMLNRCYSKKNKSYRFYGEKGIKICDEWLENQVLFNDWSIHNGYKDGLTIDRIDENKDYCPENCRWITREENSKWKSTTNYIKVNEILDSGIGWSKRLGFGVNYINTYLRNNGMEQTIEFIKNKLYIRN